MIGLKGDLIRFSIIILLSCFFAISFIAIESHYTDSTAYAASQAEEQNKDILGKIAAKYSERTNSWASGLQSFAQRLFRELLLIDLVMFAIAAGIGMTTGGKSLGQVLGEFVLLVIIPAAFMFCVIKFYPTWSKEIVKGLSHIAGQVEPKSNLGANSFFIAGISIFDGIWSAFKVRDPETWPLILAGVVIIIVYSLMAMQILLIKCESYIVLNAGIIILGLGAFNRTRSYAVNFLTYILSVAVKLYVMQLIIGIAFSFVDDFLNTAPSITNTTVILGASIVLLGLVRCIPDMCAGIIQGQHVGSGNALSGAVASAASGVMGAISGAAGVAGGASAAAKAIKATSDAANMAGLSGMSKLGYMAQRIGETAWSVNEQSGQAKGTFMGRLNSRLQQKTEDVNMSKDNGNERN